MSKLKPSPGLWEWVEPTKDQYGAHCSPTLRRAGTTDADPDVATGGECQWTGQIVVDNHDDARVMAGASLMWEFVERLAGQPCEDLPGEYPEAGEEGKAPCLPCEAKQIVAQIEGRRTRQWQSPRS